MGLEGRHMVTMHGPDIDSCVVEKDIEFNCMECDLQTTSEAHLNKHINLKHRLTCKICEEVFKEKTSLMQHRKTEHKSSVAPCRKFSVGECPYNENKCWWNHTDKENLSENVQCFICSKTYKSKG